MNRSVCLRLDICDGEARSDSTRAGVYTKAQAAQSLGCRIPPGFTYNFLGIDSGALDVPNHHLCRGLQKYICLKLSVHRIVWIRANPRRPPRLSSLTVSCILSGHGI